MAANSQENGGKTSSPTPANPPNVEKVSASPRNTSRNHRVDKVLNKAIKTEHESRDLSSTDGAPQIPQSHFDRPIDTVEIDEINVGSATPVASSWASVVSSSLQVLLTSLFKMIFFFLLISVLLTAVLLHYQPSVIAAILVELGEIPVLREYTFQALFICLTIKEDLLHQLHGFKAVTRYLIYTTIYIDYLKPFITLASAFVKIVLMLVAEVLMLVGRWLWATLDSFRGVACQNVCQAL